MDISKIAPKYVQDLIKEQKNKMTEADKDAYSRALKYDDVNKDGKTTGIDLYKGLSSTCESVFAGNDEFLAKGEELAQLGGEIYALFAGEDGCLDEFEYSAAINSKEMDEIYAQFWAMKNALDEE